MTTRKTVMKEKEMVWRNNKKLSDLEEVAKERAQNLLQRANKLWMEQEEELKDMSKVGGPAFLPSSYSNSGQHWFQLEVGQGGGKSEVRGWLERGSEVGGWGRAASVTWLLCFELLCDLQ